MPNNDSNNIIFERLKWRSRRSMLEVDLYLDKFILAKGLQTLDAAELKCYAELLEMDDWSFLSLLQGAIKTDDIIVQNVIDKIVVATHKVVNGSLSRE